MRCLSAFALLVLTVPALAQSPSPFQLEEVLSSSNFARPLGIWAAPGDDTHLYVIEQNTGDIYAVTYDEGTDTYTKVTPAFLDIGVDNDVTTPVKIDNDGNEQGLLGFAFDPDYQNNGFFYVHYSAETPNNDTIIERYTALSATQADPNSGTIIFGPVDQPQTNHNGGSLEFGPDGKLYLGLGDGGSANDSGTGHVAGGNAQSGAKLLGKMLRLNTDGSVPGDNPFVGNPGFLDEIYHYGLRNPWRFSFDKKTGDLWIGDVGQNAREEVDFAANGAAGLNFGWRCEEGFNCTGMSGCTCGVGLVPPVHDFATGGNQSVIGGYVYRGEDIPDLDGVYFFASYSSPKFWRMEGPSGGVSNITAAMTAGTGNSGSITSFGQANDGELFAVRQNGAIAKIVNTSAFEGRGYAKEGTNGCPRLWGVGALTPGSAGEINLIQAKGSTLAVLFISLSENPTPFKDGMLITIPIISQIDLNTNAAGNIFLPFVWPAGIPSGTELFFQYGIDDDGATKNVSLSNGLKATAG